MCNGVLVETLELEHLKIDERYQRPLKPRVVKLIADNFDPVWAGVLNVAKDSTDGHHALIDGQQRRAAMIERGIREWPCLVTVLSPQEQARAFENINRVRQQVSIADEFKSALFRDEVKARTINQIVRDCGFELTLPGVEALRSPVWRLGCLNRLTVIYSRGLLPITLTLLRDLWGGEPGSTDDMVVGGVFAFVRYVMSDKQAAAVWERDQFVKRMAKHTFGEVLERARAMTPAGHGQWSRPTYIADALVYFHNDGRRSQNRLKYSYER